MLGSGWQPGRTGFLASLVMVWPPCAANPRWSAHRERVDWRMTRLGARGMWVAAGVSPRMSWRRRWMDCWPMWRMGWLMVVSGGVHRADSGMLSKPTTDRSPGTQRTSYVEAWMVAISDTSLAAKTAVGGSGVVSSCRARCTDTAAS